MHEKQIKEESCGGRMLLFWLRDKAENGFSTESRVLNRIYGVQNENISLSAKLILKLILYKY